MAEIVNFRRVRKAKARRAAKTEAQTNSLVFGRTKSERQAAENDRDRALRHIENHRRLPSSQDQSPAANDPARRSDD